MQGGECRPGEKPWDGEESKQFDGALDGDGGMELGGMMAISAIFFPFCFPFVAIGLQGAFQQCPIGTESEQQTENRLNPTISGTGYGGGGGGCGGGGGGGGGCGGGGGGCGGGD